MMGGGGGMLGNGAGLGGLPSLFGGPGSVLKILKKACYYFPTPRLKFAANYKSGCPLPPRGQHALRRGNGCCCFYFESNPESGTGAHASELKASRMLLIFITIHEIQLQSY